MKNIVALIFSIALVAAVGFGLSSCKEDEPPVPPKLSFAETEITVNEDDGSVEVEMVLDKAHSKDLRIEYELGGTARDQDVVGQASPDYEIPKDHGFVDIKAGQTKGVIEIEIHADVAFEPDETIEIEITDTNTDAIEVTADNEVVITIVNDDVQLTASFSGTAQTVNEAEGNGFYFILGENYVLVPVQLDKPAPADITVHYTLSGSAYDSTYAANYEPEAISPQYYDYYINGTSGELVIPAGESSANIEIAILSDFVFEANETIDITLTASDAVKVGTTSTMKVTIAQQDGKVIVLDWSEGAYTDVDMDLFLWVGDAVDNLTGVIASSAFADVTEKVEVVFVPAVITNGIFGLSHNYYAGSADPLNFKVRFIDFAGGELEEEAGEELFLATYTAANLNPYVTTKVNPIVVQTFKIVEGEYVEVTQITVPDSHSRIRSIILPKDFKRPTWRPSRPAL